MKEQLISIIIALVFAVLGAVLGIQFPNDFKAVDSLYFGLFAYLTTTSAIILWQTNKLKDFKQLLNDTSYSANHLRVKDVVIKNGTRSFDLFWGLSLLRAKEGFYNLLDSGDFIVNREQTPKFWLQSIINTDSSWLSTNVVSSDQEWETGWENKGIQYQRLGIETSNIIVKRVFIFDTPESINNKMRDIMLKHQENGIQVKWITKDSNNLIWSPFELFEQLIGTTDFAVIDNEYLLSFLLTKDKNITSVKCTQNKNLVSKINDLYARLWEQSKLITEL